MRLLGSALLLAAALIAAPAHAQERAILGFGRIFNNDLLGDGQDRWRTGSYTWSLVHGTGWTGQRPESFGALIDYRFHSEIIAPDRLNGTGSRSRLYAGIFSVGAHTHFRRGLLDYSLGGDLVITGPQTRIDDVQEWFHELISAPRVDQATNQVGDNTHLQGTAEVALPMRQTEALQFRPYAELQAGVENLVRVGGDIVFGEMMQDDLLLRDSVTGHIYRGTEGDVSGLAFVAGADMTWISDSLYLPESGRATLTEERMRYRAGVHWQPAPDLSFFYGMTYLSEEFDEQPEGQVLGSVKLNIYF
ncbi:lipid A-modifier LpxR family protein [Pelagovum pacificum]|uniref:Lipid A deacylase LpxR family protein n=1 Tax=Pelagovum pacificum TaxID=2588711 RepID=A0A5C5G8Y4_9RHOB|nr:lipid A-modifier LpxR family protein [Pelagovum pacificum]QQA42090.1 DUF2219 family protein [Pelagovum pacificum]TNY31178.1 lipid A deacylase LpxR family protein [Pelagovum pacificum]